MTTFHATPLLAAARPRPISVRRGLASLSRASLLALALAGIAEANDGKPYAPTPAGQLAPTAAEEAALRQRRDQEESDALAGAGLSSAAREREEMRALGQNPDDPIALNAYRAETQASPDTTTATGDFILNTGWGSGGLNPERYAGSDDGSYRGIKAARLSTGEVVVVGAVRFSASSALQLGITKRKADGSRATWSGVDPQYSQFSGQYIVYPNTNITVPSIYSVHDVKVRGDRIYVLVTGHLTSPNTYAPNVLCFNANGSGCGWWFAYFNPGSSVNDAVAMDIHADYLVVLGRHSLGETGGFWTAKWKINTGGGLENATFTSFPTPGGYDRSEPADIAFRRIGSLVVAANPGYYVLFTKKVFSDAANTDYDPCLLAVKSDHTPDTSFDTAGVRCAAFDDAESSRTDKAVALATNGWSEFSGGLLVNHEGVQALVSVARKTDDGIGVWELLDRANHPRFGATGGAAGSHARGSGRVVLGGCGASEGEGCFSPIFGSAEHTPMDLANVGEDMVVVGYRYGTGLIGSGSTRRESTLLARLHGDSGELRQFTTFASGYSEGRFNSLAVRGDHDVIGIGEAIDSGIATATARTQIMTGLSNDDAIFKNGFD